MTITLAWQWWFVPLLTVLIGVLWAHIYRIKNPNNGGMFPDIAPAVILIGCLIAAIAMTLGSFL